MALARPIIGNDCYVITFRRVQNTQEHIETKVFMGSNSR